MFFSQSGTILTQTMYRLLTCRVQAYQAYVLHIYLCINIFAELSEIKHEAGDTDTSFINTAKYIF